MKQRPLGKTDLQCSVLGLGTWALGGSNEISGIALGWREIPEPTIHEIIRAAIDVGINFFDSSDMYGQGRAESLLGKALGADKNKVVVATKGGLLDYFLPGTLDFARDFSGAHLKEAVHGSLKRLNREWIDLYQLHGPDLTVAQNNDTWRTLHDLVSEGKIRHFGVSLGSRTSDLSEWTKPCVASIQARYNLIHIQEATAVDNWRSDGCALIARSVLEHGLLTDRYSAPSDFAASDHRGRKMSVELIDSVQALGSRVSAALRGRNCSLVEVALGYALSSPTVSVTLVGATSVEQVCQNATIAEATSLLPWERELVTQIAERIFVPNL
jgi:aryl-alcohol dehydrogenase-like predicted oxidoreductase